MKIKRRETEVFSLSFLDVICCGFGAIILLLVLTEFGRPVQIEISRENMNQQLKKLQQELFDIRGDSDRLERDLKGRTDELARERLNLARAAGELSSIGGQFKASKQNAAVSNILENELLTAYQELEEQNKKLLQVSRSRKRIATQAVGGIPVDSDYVIFLIDTSGSMQGGHWDTAQAVMKEILDIYPKLKGVQVIDDNGKEMFSGTRGQTALDAIDRVNKADQGGRRRVRIHAVGFPEAPGMTPFTNIRFSALMRQMCERNDGTFVGITNEKSCAVSMNVGGINTCMGGSD